ncbi:hypothetical protein D3C85_1466970 [compost metagenome]
MLISRARLLTSNSTEAPGMSWATFSGVLFSRLAGMTLSRISRGMSTPRSLSRPIWITGRTSPVSGSALKLMSWRRFIAWFR